MWTRDAFPRGALPRFRSAYQGGDAVELLSMRGKDPEKKWGLHGRVVKAFDSAVKGFVLRCSGGPTTKIELPASAKSTRECGSMQRHRVAP